MTASIQALNLQPFGITRPNRLRWFYNHQTTDFFDSLRSKTLRAFLSKADEYFAEFSLDYSHKTLTAAEYQEWWQHYRASMEQKKYDVIATPEWYDQKSAEGKVVKGFFFYQKGVLKGTSVYAQQGTDKVFAAYKTTTPIPGLSKKNRSLSALIDYVFLTTMLAEGIKTISMGSMRNAFGVYNRVGNLELKLRFGLLPTIKEHATLETTVPLAENGQVVFFGLKKTVLTCFLARPAGVTSEPWELARFASAIMPFEILEYQPTQLITL